MEGRTRARASTAAQQKRWPRSRTRNTAKHGIPQMHSLQKERDGNISPKIEKFSDLGVFQSPEVRKKIARFLLCLFCMFFFPPSL
jgi:hypothetical protein